MNAVERVARKMCEAAGFEPDAAVTRHPLRDGPIPGTWLMPQADIHDVAWMLFAPQAKATLMEMANAVIAQGAAETSR